MVMVMVCLCVCPSLVPRGWLLGRLSRLLQCREEVEVLSLLIRHQPLLTGPLDSELKELQTRLAAKCARLQHLR
jgi:hypothetical protein